MARTSGHPSCSNAVPALGLSSASWGSVNFGRQYTPVLVCRPPTDLFRVAGVGSIYSLTNVGVTRLDSSSIRYDSSPALTASASPRWYALGDTSAPHPSALKLNRR